MMEHKEIYKKAVKTWGKTSQLDMLVEECAEVIVAVKKLKRFGTLNERIKLEKEVADVEIMCEQFRIVYEDNQVDRYKLEKLERLESLINKNPIKAREKE